MIQIDLLDLYASLTLDSTKYEAGISNAERQGKQASNRLDSTFTGAAKSVGSGITSTVGHVASGIKTMAAGAVDAVGKITNAVANAGKVAGGIAAAGLGVASAATVKLGKDAFDAYGEYEQLAGGIETLFGENSEASKAVKGFADNAFSTVQMSANDYMATVTDFSATLLQKLDPTDAANKADQALRQMSDNANKMGTSVDTVEDAYRGLAKSNATMLDNLKLGYGGNQGELARLINDAGVLGDVIADEKNVWDVASFDQIIDAIGVIQERLGMAGVSQEEALHTIQGSINMTKAAWENLLAGWANPDADLEKLTSNLMESLDAVTENAVPAVERILTSAADAITKAAPDIRTRVTGLIRTVAPSVMKSAAALMKTVTGVLADTAPDLVDSLLGSIEEVLAADDGSVADAFVSMFVNVAGVLANHAPQLIESFFGVVSRVITGLLDRMSEDPTAALEAGARIIGAVVDGMTQLVGETVPRLGSVITGMFDGGIDAVDKTGLGDKLRNVFGGLLDGVDGLTPESVANFCTNAVTALADGLSPAIETVIPTITGFIAGFVSQMTSEENMAQFGTAATTMLTAICDGIGTAVDNGDVEEFMTGIGKAISGIITWLTSEENISKLTSTGGKLIGAVGRGLGTDVGEIGEGTGKAIENISSHLFSDFNLARVLDGAVEFLANIAIGLINGLTSIFVSLGRVLADGINAILHINTKEQMDENAQDIKDFLHLDQLDQGAVYNGFRRMEYEAGMMSSDEFMASLDPEYRERIETANRAAQAYNDPSRANEGWVIENHTSVDIDGNEVGSAVDRYALDKLAQKGW